MNKFKIVLQYLSGYKKYQCPICKGIFGVSKNRKDEPFIWCMYCGKGYKK